MPPELIAKIKKEIRGPHYKIVKNFDEGEDVKRAWRTAVEIADRKKRGESVTEAELALADALFEYVYS